MPLRRCKQGNVEWLEFELLTNLKGIKHAIFLRHGGVSPAPYSSLNAGGGSSDCPNLVAANLEIMREVLRADRLVTAHQNHGIDIVPIPTSEYPQGDVLFTQEKNIGLVIRHADCQATLIYDPENHVLANVHCGWRGNVQNVYSHAIKWMQKKVGSDPKKLLVCISPSLGPEASEFKNFERELPPSFLPYQFKPTYFNLWEVSRNQILDLGILPEHLEIAQICTFSNPEDFFSYRRKKESGRHATIAVLT